MAIQTVNFVKGTIDGVVFYEMSGGHFARSAPKKMTQSEATKKRSKNFGIASPAAAAIRRLLSPVLPFPKDQAMQRSFNGALINWLKQKNAEELSPGINLPFITGFSFNKKTAIGDRWKINITCNQVSADEVQIHIPAFNPAISIAAPASASTVECTFVAACCHLIDKNAASAREVSVAFPYHDSMVSHRLLSLPLTTLPGCLVVVAASMKFKSGLGIPDYRPEYLPSSVIGAWYTG